MGRLLPEEAEQVDWIVSRLTERQIDALRALRLKAATRLATALPWFTAGQLGTSGATLFSLSDFMRGERGIQPPLILAQWHRDHHDGRRYWKITPFGEAVLERFEAALPA